MSMELVRPVITVLVAPRLTELLVAAGMMFATVSSCLWTDRGPGESSLAAAVSTATGRGGSRRRRTMKALIDVRRVTEKTTHVLMAI